MKRCLPIVVAAAFLGFACVGPIAMAAPANVPDTAVGRLGAELIRHVNADTADQIRKWTSTVLSSAIDAGDASDFVNGLVSAVRESGGVIGILGHQLGAHG